MIAKQPLLNRLRRASGLILLVLLLGGCGRADFLDSEGKGINLADYQGQWLVVNYWAEWCAPCKKEIPELNELHAAPGNRINVIGVNFDAPELEELRRQMADFKIAFPVIQSDASDKFSHPRPEVLPTTYIYDPQGRLAHTLIGPQTRDEIETLIHSLES